MNSLFFTIQILFIVPVLFYQYIKALFDPFENTYSKFKQAKILIESILKWTFN